MQPRSQFSSGNSAHEPTSSVRRAQPLNSGRVTQESIQLTSPPAQLEELIHSTQDVLLRSQFSSDVHSASAPGAQQLRTTSSTTLHKPCSLGVSSAQAIQLMSLPAQLEELSHPTQDVLLRSQFSSNSSAH